VIQQMCTGSDQVPGSIAEALRMTGAGLDYLNSPASAELPAAAAGEVLAALGVISAKVTAAHAAFLRRFDAAGAHDSDGYGTSASWLAARTQLSVKDARAAVRRMRQLTEHVGLAEALARGELSWSWAEQIIELTRKLPAELHGQTDQILLDAAARGASLDDLRYLAGCAVQQWLSRHPDSDEDGFDDRYVQVGTTFGGAACIRGNLTPECGAAVKAVLEALGKKAGPEDHRTEHQRFHDALQAGCELLIRAKMVPGRQGADTRVEVHIPISQLRDMPGGSELEDAWIRGRLDETGYLIGKDAEAAACDALIVPVVTGHADLTVVDKMIALAFAAIDGGWPGHGAGTSDGADTHPGTGPVTGGPVTGGGPGDGSDDSGSDGAGARVRSRAMSPEAWAALRYAIARLAVDLVSGPAGLAAFLRTQLLEAPWNTPSLPLDIGYSEDIPASIRRAVLLRDRRCAWPRCGRPAVYCDVHHIRHKKDGGKTSVGDCVLLCQFHHDVCIHRWGWQIVLHPDGTTSAYGPRGQVLHSHSPPTVRAG
jgi:hypothetical protein